MSDWALDGDATIVGGDMNLNALWLYCDPNGPNPDEYVNRLKPLYYSNFGPGNKNCGPGRNYYYEADNDRDTAGDGIYDESTVAGSTTQRLTTSFSTSSGSIPTTAATRGHQVDCPTTCTCAAR